MTDIRVPAAGAIEGSLCGCREQWSCCPLCLLGNKALTAVPKCVHSNPCVHRGGQWCGWQCLPRPRWGLYRGGACLPQPAQVGALFTFVARQLARPGGGLVVERLLLDQVLECLCQPPGGEGEEEARREERQQALLELLQAGALADVEPRRLLHLARQARLCVRPCSSPRSRLLPLTARASQLPGVRAAVRGAAPVRPGVPVPPRGPLAQGEPGSVHLAGGGAAFPLPLFHRGGVKGKGKKVPEVSR